MSDNVLGVPHLEQQIAALAARVAQLEAERWTGPPRLGPMAADADEVNARVEKLTATITAALEQPPPVDRSAVCTTNGKTPEEVRAGQTNATGQYDGYIVLCDAERAKGFVRPYRDRYKHTTCGGVTTMGRSLSETYARDPGFYGATFCCNCNAHHPVAEFVWTADGTVVGS